jgi:Fe-S cluster assembly protein SufD
VTVSAAPGGLEHYQDAHRAFVARDRTGGDWLSALRTGAFDRFSELGFPLTKQEDWRFTNVAPLTETEFRLAAGDAGTGAEVALDRSLELVERAPRLVFVNGRYNARRSHVEGLPAGVRVQSLRTALDGDGPLVRAHLGRYATFDDQPFRALNTAFLSDGAVVHVPVGVQLPHPLQLLFLSASGEEALVSHPRVMVVLERGARAVVVETFAGLADGVYWTNAVSELVVGDGARLDYYRVQAEAEGAYHVASTHAHQGSDSIVNLHTVATGAALARHDIRLTLAGAGAVGLLNGLYLPRGTQHMDHHTLIDHAQPRCESHEYFNGVLADAARSVFTGRIIVRPGAQRTDSKQTNNNLLLSSEARADSQPQLEIHADDVKCTHGSTTGPLDERQVFYLRTRGLDGIDARRLLAYGFAAEILGRMDVEALRERLDMIVRERVSA